MHTQVIKTTGDIHRPYRILKIVFGYGVNPEDAVRNLDVASDLGSSAPKAIIGIRLYHTNQDVAYGTEVQILHR